MTNSPVDLLFGKEARESSRVKVIVLQDNRDSSFPNKAFRTREQLLQELILTAEVHIDNSVTKTRSTASVKDVVDTGHRILSILHRLEFSVAVHGLGCRALHDDMDGTALVVANQASLTTKELDDFLLGDGVRDLYSKE